MKIFENGQFSGLFGDSSSSNVKSSVGSSIGSTIDLFVDHSSQTSKPSKFSELLSKFVNGTSNADSVSPLPGPLTSIGKISYPSTENVVSVIPKIEPQSFSRESSLAGYETLYHEFHLKVEPIYNFWTEDEEENETEEKGTRQLTEVPRYIRVFWDAAPDLPSLASISPKWKFSREIDPVKFGLECDDEYGLTMNGSNYVPEHLQPSGFALIKRSLGNGFVIPGVISALVEIPMKNASQDSDIFRSSDHFVNISEDAFLTLPEMQGVSIHELISNCHEVINGLLDTSWLSETPVSAENVARKEELFDGNFSLDRSLSGAGAFQISGVQSSSPVFSMLSKVSKAANQHVNLDSLNELVNLTSESPHVSAVEVSQTNRIKFINPSIDGVVSEEKVNLMDQPHHAENMIAIAQSLPNLDVLAESGFHEEIKKLDAPSFPSPAGLRPLEYIGYVLEKYKMNDRGSFEVMEEIDLPNREFTEYIDTKVAYGGTYRYRIKSIIRWTRPADKDLNGADSFSDPQSIGSTKPTAPFESSYFGSEWSESWGYASIMDMVPPPPPDEMVVRPESARKRISISIKFPENAQKDIWKMQIFRKIQNSAGQDITGWTKIGDTFGPQNAHMYDTNVDFFQKNGIRYAYTAQSISRHSEYSTYSEQLATRLNADYKTLGEFPVDFISSPGVRSEYFGAFSTIPIRKSKSEVIVPVKTEKDGVAKSAIFTISGRESSGNGSLGDVMYFIRIESLDTGEKRDFSVSTTFENMMAKVNTYGIDPTIQGANVLDKVGRSRKIDASAGLTFGTMGPGGIPAVPTDR